MAKSRVEKYKEYRSQLIREGVPERSDSRKFDSTQTIGSQTLPLDEVYDSLSKQNAEENEIAKIERQKMVLKYVSIGIFLLLVAAAIVVFAIFAFKK